MVKLIRDQYAKIISEFPKIIKWFVSIDFNHLSFKIHMDLFNQNNISTRDN